MKENVFSREFKNQGKMLNVLSERCIQCLKTVVLEMQNMKIAETVCYWIYQYKLFTAATIEERFNPSHRLTQSKAF